MSYCKHSSLYSYAPGSYHYHRWMLTSAALELLVNTLNICDTMAYASSNVLGPLSITRCNTAGLFKADKKQFILICSAGVVWISPGKLRANNRHMSRYKSCNVSPGLRRRTFISSDVCESGFLILNAIPLFEKGNYLLLWCVSRHLPCHFCRCPY